MTDSNLDPSRERTDTLVPDPGTDETPTQRRGPFALLLSGTQYPNSTRNFLTYLCFVMKSEPCRRLCLGPPRRQDRLPGDHFHLILEIKEYLIEFDVLSRTLNQLPSFVK